MVMALSHVDVVGLKQAAWRNLMSSLVLVEVVAAWADGCRVIAGAVGCKSRYQRPLAWRVPLRTCRSPFSMMTASFVKVAMQP